MDSQPPNGNQNNPERNPERRKDTPYDGSANNRQADTVDVFGDMRDSPAVVIMFLVGVASWLLRERCVC